jgi:hypothetical protein
MTHSEQSDSRATASRLMEALAKSLAVYYAAERAFMESPTEKSAHDFFVAQDRYSTLREECRRANRLGDAICGTENDESVGR